MVRGIDPALLIFAGRFLSQGGGDPSNGFGNALGAGLEAAGSQQIFRMEQERTRQQDLMKAAETSINMKRALQELQIVEQQRRAQEQFIQDQPLDQQSAAAVIPNQAALLEFQQANPPPITPFQQEQLRIQGQPKPEQLEEVFDPETGTVRYVPRSQAVGQLAPPKQGITIGPDGTVQIGGTPGATQLSKKSVNTVQDLLIDVDNKRQRLTQIASTWKPEYNQIGTRLGLAWENIKDKAQFLGPVDEKELRDFSQFKQNALTNINHTIQEITGAAMGVQEAKRIRITEADAGTGIFDGDGPVAFKAKLDNAINTVNLARARLGYLLQNGISYTTSGPNAFNNISLDQMPTLIDMRGQALEEQYIRNGMDPREAEQLVADELRREFGL